MPPALQEIRTATQREAWPGKPPGGIGLALIFLVLFASRQKGQVGLNGEGSLLGSNISELGYDDSTPSGLGGLLLVSVLIVNPFGVVGSGANCVRTMLQAL
jgi:hypothetical protein